MFPCPLLPGAGWLLEPSWAGDPATSMAQVLEMPALPLLSAMSNENKSISCALLL